MNKKIFITGLAGFIGYHLALALHQQHIPILGCDNFNSYYDPALKRRRATELKKLGIEVLDLDICDVDALNESIQLFQPTHLVHLAAQAGVRYSLDNPKAYIKSNIDGFLNILEICRGTPSIKLIYASSSSVYGLNEKVPFSVDDRTDHQASLYGVTKKTNELMAATYHHLFGITAIGLRFFTVYGPWGRPDMAYFSFTRDILAGHPINIYNFGKMERDFTYIDDIIQGIIAAIGFNSQTGCEVFNLGHHQPEQLGQLIELIESELGIKAKKNLLPMQSGDVLATYADIEVSRQQLGFQPKVSLKEGISRFIRWYQSYYHAQ